MKKEIIDLIFELIVIITVFVMVGIVLGSKPKPVIKQVSNICPNCKEQMFLNCYNCDTIIDPNTGEKLWMFK